MVSICSFYADHGQRLCLLEMHHQRQDYCRERRRRRATGAHRHETLEDALNTAEISQPNISYYAFLNDYQLEVRLAKSGRPSATRLSRVRIVWVTTLYDGSPLNRKRGRTNNLVMNQSPLLEALDEQNTPYPITLARDVSVFNVGILVQKGKRVGGFLRAHQ